MHKKSTQFFLIQSKIAWIPLSLLSSLFLILCFPEPGFSLLAWIALVPLFIIMLTSSFKKTLLAALITGVLFNTVYLYWMKEYKHPLALSGGVFGELVFWFAAVILSYFLYHSIPSKEGNASWLKILGLVFGWFSIDYVKTIGFLAFPWGILGYSQYENLLLIQSASIFGVWGIDLLILYCNAAVAALCLGFMRQRENAALPVPRRFMHMFIVVFLLICSLVWGGVMLAQEKRSSFQQKRVALVQANFDPWSPQLQENIMLEMELTVQGLKHDPDLVVWSESSVPFPYEYHLERDSTHALQVHRFASSLHRPFVFGSLEFERTEQGDGKYYNVAVYYNDGILQDSYRKIHLVPFGEWFPYKRLFPFVVKILEEAGAGDFVPGNQYEVYHDSDFRFSVLICFEDVFGNLARKFVLRGSQLLINVTNDAWTGSEKAEVQHYSISVFRTVENRRSLVRAANGGVTVCVNPYGRPKAQLPLFISDVLVCDVDIVDSGTITFYTRYGDFLPLIVLSLSFLAALFFLVKKFIDILSSG